MAAHNNNFAKIYCTLTFYYIVYQPIVGFYEIFALRGFYGDCTLSIKRTFLANS